MVQKDSEYLVRMYYEHQYDRLAKLNDQRLRVSGLISTLSILVFTFGFDYEEAPNVVSGIALPIIIILANYLSIVYVTHSQRLKDMHKSRAKKVLSEYAPHLSTIDQGISGDRLKTWFSFSMTLYILHVLFVVISLLLIVIYWTDLIP